MEPTSQIVIIGGRRRPHELMLLLFSLVAGAAMLLGAPRPNSMTEEMNTTLVTLWAVGLFLGGLIGIWGCYTRNNLARGLLLERAGELISAGAAFGYAMQVVSINGGRAGFAAGFCIAWAVANVVRSLQISNDLRSLRGGRRAA